MIQEKIFPRTTSRCVVFVMPCREPLGPSSIPVRPVGAELSCSSRRSDWSIVGTWKSLGKVYTVVTQSSWLLGVPGSCLSQPQGPETQMAAEARSRRRMKKGGRGWGKRKLYRWREGGHATSEERKMEEEKGISPEGCSWRQVRYGRRRTKRRGVLWEGDGEEDVDESKCNAVVKGGGGEDEKEEGMERG